ncbi:hypothetical protein [Geomonas subterranea]|uniref:hypothetical protein n=1 Tax=Geomonas subterranea TaxID=2847989 RepID=UPI001CD7D4CC|nr:hypothetical protein [Geomonas fuzhouensis]
MANRIKCIALSALVLPGLGQLYRGSRVKGGVMLLLDNIFLLGGLFVGLRSAGKLIAAGQQGLTPEQVLAAIQVDAPYVKWLLGAFMILWAYGVVDAAFFKGDN